MPHKRIALFLSGLVLVGSARASTSLLNVSVEPVVGYERSQRLVPTAHTHDHLVYGARMLVGIPLLEGEAEYLHGNDSESFPTQGMSTTDSTDEAKLGLRSTWRFLHVLGAHVRAGAQATRNNHRQTQNGVTTGGYQPIVYNPYAGAGLEVHLGHHVSFTADLTAIFHKFPDMNQNDYQATAGFNVSFP